MKKKNDAKDNEIEFENKPKTRELRGDDVLRRAIKMT